MEQAVALAIQLRVAPRLATLGQIELPWLMQQTHGSIILSIPRATPRVGALELDPNGDGGTLICELIRDFRQALQWSRSAP
jgi:hypothetical protein